MVIKAAKELHELGEITEADLMMICAMQELEIKRMAQETAH